VSELVGAVRAVYVSQPVKRYAIDLVAATRTSPDLRLGASPRATLQLVRAARAHAALAGRDYVIPDDLQDLAVSVLAHRLLPSLEAQGQRRMPEQVVTGLLGRVPVPEGSRR
jgi:MoxR-like ATPases